jgi:hypothetical protein
MTSKQRVSATLDHRQPDRVPVDFGSTFVSGVHVSCVAALRDYFGLEKRPVKAIDPGQMLGEIEEDLKAALGIDTQGIFRRNNRFGFSNEDWKPWRMYDGLEILVPGGFNITIDHNGDTLMHPLGDTSLPPSSRMPNGGYFFDPIMRQGPIDDDHLNPADNLEEYMPISDDELAYLERAARRAAGAGRAVVASFGGTSFGDIAHVPGVGLRNPKGIRDITEWYISTRARRDYVNAVFAGQTEIALANLARIAPPAASVLSSSRSGVTPRANTTIWSRPGKPPSRKSKAMPKTSRMTPTADEIAEMASRGEDVSVYFTNKFSVVRPVHRVNVDLTQGMLRELDERAARLNVSRQAVIKTLLRQVLDELRGSRTRSKKKAGQ